MSDFMARYPREDDTNEPVNVAFTRAEFYDLVYAAREAHIRFKRARTEFRNGNERYAHMSEECCTEDAEFYASMEDMLKERYREAYGEWW